MAATGGAANPSGAGHILAMFRAEDALTRAQVMERTGLSRSTVNQRVDALLVAGLITSAGDVTPARGRPAETFAFNRTRGVLLVCDVGATGTRAALCDLSGAITAERSQASDVTRGPEPILADIGRLFDSLLTQAGRSAADVHGIGLSVPGPVDFDSAQVISPPIMTGWDRYDIRGWFATSYQCPVLVDKDANAMAWGEHRTVHPDIPNMLMVKLGTGVGSGIIAAGQIFRGADGAAGDIGHTQLSPESHSTHLCRCGNTGCVEASAGGWALIRDLREQGRSVEDVDGVVSLIRSGDPVAVQLARNAGRVLGVALSEAVNLLNPRAIIVGGQLARADEQIFAGIREMIYKCSLPLATRALRIEPSTLDRRAGSIGLALLVADEIFSPARVGQALQHPGP